MPRPVSNYFASLSCGLFLLEHAVWLSAKSDPSLSTDIESLRRWIEEGDLEPSRREIEKVSHDHRSRAGTDKVLVFDVVNRSTIKHRL
jgi:hypothetical protein